MPADKETLRSRLLEAGAVAVGFADAAPLPESEIRSLDDWIAAGCNAGMDWMARHAALRADPANVLPGVRTVISCAFSYTPLEVRDPGLPHISRYAYGEDYHTVLRDVITEALADTMPAGEWRVCVDSAPLSERYWATRAGIGFLGDNGALIVPDVGCEVFLAEILTTMAYDADEPTAGECLHCGACRTACPTGAMLPSGRIDCSRCISYLTIEHRGEWSDPEAIRAMTTPAGHNALFGCDACVSACPLNSGRHDLTLSRFRPLPQVMVLGKEIPDCSNRGFVRLFSGSALLRAGRQGLMRNARNLK